MHGYISSKELKDTPIKSWVTETDAQRLERIAKAMDMKPSALIRKAVLLAMARVEKEGYAALFQD